MSIIGWLIIGALAGWIGSKLTGTDQQVGCLGNVVAGIAGALLGGFLFGVLFNRDWDSGFDIGTLLLAIVGAVMVLGLWGWIRKRG